MTISDQELSDHVENFKRPLDLHKADHFMILLNSAEKSVDDFETVPETAILFKKVFDKVDTITFGSGIDKAVLTTHQFSDVLFDVEELLKKKVKEQIITNDVIIIYYNENKLRYMCVPLYKIVVKDKAMIEVIKLQIEDEDEEYEAFTKKYSLSKNTSGSGGYMGVIQRRHLPVEIESQIFAAQENETLGPFEGNGLYSIYKTGKVVNHELDDTMKENITHGLFDLWTNNLLDSLKIEVSQ